MAKLLILDKDGTLVRPASGSKYVDHPQDQELIPGVAQAIQNYSQAGWTPMIASNQGGIAAGHKRLEDGIAEMQYCLELLPEILCAFFCPDLKGDQCWLVDRDRWADGEPLHLLPWAARWVGRFRKPGGGMLRAAMETIDGHPLQSLYVGDRGEDQRAAKTAGIPFLWATNWRNLGQPYR